MAVKLIPLSLAALALALPMSQPAGAQPVYSAGGSVIVNFQALDRLGPPLPGFAGAQNPQAAAFGAAPRPLLGETGPTDSNAKAAKQVKLRPPRATKATVAPAVAKAAAPAVPKPAPQNVSRPSSPAAAAAPVASINLPPPVVATPAPNVSAPSVSPPSISAPVAGQPLQLPKPPASSAVGAVATAAASAPAVVAAAPSVSAPAVSAPSVSTPPAVAAPPAPASVPAPAASNPISQQTALLTPPAASSAAPSGNQVNLSFEPGKSELAGSGTAALEAMARSLANTEDRIQIRAYASASGSDAASGARRLSLSRALAVRGFLIDRGIRSTRIDVRALGTPSDSSPPDRVEVVPMGR